MDASAARSLLAQVIDWPGASERARQIASDMWHDLAAPEWTDPGQLAGPLASLAGELRRCQYSRSRQVSAAVAGLRDLLTPPGDAAPAGHGAFAERTRNACRAAGLDL